MRPIFSFKNIDRHNEEIEKLRRAERSVDASQVQALLPAASPKASPLQKL
jgi:hypothetical protein